MAVQPEGAKDCIARWLETLSAFTFEVQHRAGKKHGNADAMSRRCPNPQDCNCPLLDTDEQLQCGPCKKCNRKAEVMGSTMSLNKQLETPEAGKEAV